MADEKEDLEKLLARLDPASRKRWGEYLSKIEREISERGPSITMEHLEKTLQHLLATAWLLHRCYDADESQPVLQTLGAIAETLESLRAEVLALSKKPEWSQ